MSTALGSSAARRGGSADSGARVRGVLFSPAAGFAPALRRAESAPERLSTYLLGAAGGASGMLLWLKATGLIGSREVTASGFSWGVFVSALVLGAIVAVFAQAAWGALAPRIDSSDGPTTKGYRAIWALSAWPQVLALVLLLPLDLLLVGREAFTAERIGDSVSMAWAALSTAFALSLAVWSAYVFVKGVQVAIRATPGRTAGVVAAAAGCSAAVLVGVGAALVGLEALIG